jgi:signal transduction histidine kinase
MLMVGIPILVFGLHDILTVNNLRDRRDGLTIQYSVIPVILLFSWFLLKRFLTSIKQAEQLAMTLEARVEQKQQQVHEQYQQLKTFEQQQVLSEERERIMRDMHDGVGSHLVSVMMMLQQQDNIMHDPIREKVQLSLTDLRFVIDSLDPVLDDLATLLGMMRARLHEQLESAEIELEWDVNELPELSEISPRRSLHIMRIVQEAVTNVIKHSQAKKMKLSTSINSDEIYIEVIDFGRGIDTNMPENKIGRGVKNMKYRAEQIGASLELVSTEDGTRIRLGIPLGSKRNNKPSVTIT